VSLLKYDRSIEDLQRSVSKEEEMKRTLVAVLMLVVAVLGGGCITMTQGIPGSMPIPASTWMQTSDMWAVIDAHVANPNAFINLERSDGYSSVSVERIQNTANQLIMGSQWDSHTACEAFIVQMKRGDPNAAVGLILLGSEKTAWYRVITLDIRQGVMILRLVDPVAENISDWNDVRLAAFVCM
jgi:hypothetical protein